MDPCAGWHGVIVTLFLILKLGLWHCQEAERFSPTLSLEIHNDSLHQRLLVEWNISKKAHEPDMDVMFHIQVARSENMNIIANKIFQPDLYKSRVAFSWSWDSQLPLECDSHSVRIRSAVTGKISTGERNWSTWSPWKTLQGQNTERTRTVIYPYQRVVPEGSDVTFCCLPGRGQTVEKMKYGSEMMRRDLDLGTDSYVISVRNVTRTRSDGTNVICVVDQMTAGTVLIVSRLPDEPQHFSCETQDLLTLRCSWRPGDMYNFFRILKVTYVLQEWLSMKSYSCHRDHCVLPVEMNQETYNFTLTATNRLGKRSINSVVYLTQRVLLLAPTSLRVDHENASSVTLSWSLRADYTSLIIQCQVKHQKTLVNVTRKGKRPTQLYKVSLSGLQPYTQYQMRVRCMAESSLAGWSHWTDIVVRTKEDAPTGALDVWRHIEDDDGGGRTVTLYWRPSPLFRANGNISHYNIKFWPQGGAPEAEEISDSGVNSFPISIGQQAYSITVTAHNKAGGSPPAELRIPAKAASGTEEVAADRPYGKDGGIYITWQRMRDVHGYVVEWCSAPRSSHCDLQWKKYNSTIYSDVIQSRAFHPGVRYDFRIYGSKKDGEHLLEKAAGYTAELVSSVKPNVKISKIESRSIFLDWSPYPTDGSQEGFVTGYKVYVYNTESDCDLDKADDYVQLGHFHACRFYIRDPNKTQITINKLKPNGKYEVAVVAVTGGGETPAEFIKAHTPTDTGAAIRSMIVPIVMVSALALVLLFIGCWKRTWLKRMCFPDIPDPNKSKIFSFPGKKGTMNGNILPTITHEPQMVDVVSIQENKEDKMNQDENLSSEHQQHEIYTKIQTREGSECEQDPSEGYVPCDTETSLCSPMNDPLYISQPLFCLEFFNQTYTSTSEDVNDNVVGYRPQMNIAQCPPYTKQFDHKSVISFNSPHYGSEPMSPNYRSEPMSTDYGSKPMSADYGSEPMSANYGSKPMRANYGSEPMSANYGSEPMSANYGSEPMRANYGSEPMSANYGSELMSANYGSKPMSADYGSEPMSPHYGSEPMSLHYGSEPMSLHYGSEPMSPTSVGSTTFILVD